MRSTVRPQMCRMIGRELLGELVVHLLEVAVVVLARDEVAGGVIGQRERVGAGLDLGHAEVDRRLLEPLEHELRLGRVVERHQQERLDAERVVARATTAPSSCR